MAPRLALLLALLGASLEAALAVRPSGDRVPVLMWTSDEGAELREALAGHTLSAADFRERYVAPLLARPSGGHFVVFLQDKLSVADISHYADVYGYKDSSEDDAFTNVQSLMSDLPSIHLSNVHSPFSVFMDEAQTTASASFDAPVDAPLGAPVVLRAPYDLSSLGLGATGGARRLVVVELPVTQRSNVDRSTVLRSSDKIIGAVMVQLKAAAQPFTAFYTARHSSQGAGGLPDPPASPGRRLLSAVDPPSNQSYCFCNVNDMVYAYVEGVTLGAGGGAGGNGTELSISHLFCNESASVCDVSNVTDSSTNSSCQLQFNYNGTDTGLSAISLLLNFILSGVGDPGYWSLSSLKFSYVNDSDAQPVSEELDVAPLSSWTPLGYSYSCSAPPTLMPLTRHNASAGTPPAGGSTGLSVTFKRFQVQAFGRFSNGRFGAYNDCEGFFSIAIWMALICLAVMISILLFGICMLASITTMHRYDDPKGKSIVVATTAD